LLVPEETPLSEDVDFDKLARYEMSGGNIKSVIFRAAASAALRPEGKNNSSPHIIIGLYYIIVKVRESLQMVVASLSSSLGVCETIG